MADPVEMTGGCQCGAVRYKAMILPETSHICHCRMCQKAVGNYFAALVSARNDTVVWTRGAPAVFMSSDPVRRGFCSTCGTPLFYKTVKGKHTAFTIGSLDQPERVKPRTQEGVEARMTWFHDIVDVPDSGTTEVEMADRVAEIAASNHQHPDHDTDHWP